MTGSKHQQISNTILYVLPIVIGNLVPLATLPLFTRLLTQEDFGAFALANVYAVFVAGVVTVGLPLAYERNFFEHQQEHERAQLLYTIVAFVVVVLGIAGVVTWIVRHQVTAWLIGSPRYEGVVVWSFIATALVTIKAYYLTYLRNSERASAFAAFTLAERVVGAVVSVVLVAGVGTGVVGLVIAQFVASLIVLSIIIVRFARQLPFSFRAGFLLEALKIGYPLTPRIFFGVIGRNFDKYLIGQLASLGGVGVYSIGQRVAYVPFTYMTALENVFGPRVYKQMFSGDPDAGQRIGQYLTPFAYVSALCAFAVGVFAEEILVVLTPTAYHSAAPIVTVLAMYYGIQFFGKMPQFAYAKKTHLISIVTAVNVALSVACGALGVWMWGPTGAAWGTAVAGALTTALTLSLGQRYFRIEWEMRNLIAVYGLFFVAALLAITLRAFDVPYALRLLTKLGACTAFLWLGVRLRIVTLENAALVRDLVLRRVVPSPPVSVVV